MILWPISSFTRIGSSDFSWLLTASSVAAVFYVIAALDVGKRRAGTWIALAWLAHGAAILVETFGVGHALAGARFGFASALSVTYWLVLAVYVFERRTIPLEDLHRSLSCLGVIVVALAMVFPGDVHALAASPWAPLHWILGLASYGLFGVAVLHARMLKSAEARMRPRPGTPLLPETPALPLLQLEKMTFRFVLAGFLILSCAIALGFGFTPAWRWDHKTVFSLLAWVVFAVLLVGRRWWGWRGRKAVWCVYAGAGLLLLAYVGSRFVLEVLLHRPVV